MNTKEIKILETISKYQKQITGWKLEPFHVPYTRYHTRHSGNIQPHIAIAFPKDADFSNREELNNLLRYQWDEQLDPVDYSQYHINIYYISIQD